MTWYRSHSHDLPHTLKVTIIEPRRLLKEESLAHSKAISDTVPVEILCTC